MKQSIRAFAIGLFTAGTVLLIVNYFSNGSSQDLSDIPADEMIDVLKENGYRVLTESEFITLTVSGEAADNEEEQREDNESEQSEEGNEATDADEATEESEEESDASEEENSDSVISHTITIEDGMPSSIIGHELADHGIIDDANELNQYLDEEGYSLRIQLGEFTVTSDMSYFEIAEAISR